jgi:hypothetical protein
MDSKEIIDKEIKWLLVNAEHVSEAEAMSQAAVAILRLVKVGEGIKAELDRISMAISDK